MPLPPRSLWIVQLVDGQFHGLPDHATRRQRQLPYDFSGAPTGDESDWANLPVNDVSWGDAARFVNWLQNGEPTGTLTGSPSLDGWLTEDGTYDLDGATTYDALMAVTRQAGSRWWLPTENEWYKAAYFDPEKPGGAGYWQYATGTNKVPSNALLNPDPGDNANFYNTVGTPYYRTPVGAFENSISPYGTFDQDGDVWQWNETAVTSTSFGLRGGSWTPDGSASVLAASYRSYGSAPDERERQHRVPRGQCGVAR